MSAKKNSVCDLREYRELRANTLGAAASPLGKVHRQQVVCAQVVAFVAKRLKKRRPMRMRNTLPLFPLLDLGPVRANVGRHFRQGVPAGEQVVERAHAAKVTPDELSGQAPPIIPVTAKRPLRTISHMGRGV